MLAASSAATLRLPSSPKPGATIRRQHRHRHGGTGTDCGELACTRLGKRGGPRSLSAPQRSRPHKTDPMLRKGLGVDGISFAVHPPDGRRSTVHPWRPTRPPRRAVQVSTARFPSWRRVPSSLVEGSVVNCLHRIHAVDAGGARSSMDRCSGLWAAGVRCWPRV